MITNTHTIPSGRICPQNLPKFTKPPDKNHNVHFFLQFFFKGALLLLIKCSCMNYTKKKIIMFRNLDIL